MKKEKEIYSKPQILSLGRINKKTQGPTGSACDGSDTNTNGSNIQCAPGA